MAPSIQPAAKETRPLEWFARVSEDAWSRILIALTLAAYLPSINYGFVYDDAALILLNPWMASWRFAGKLVSHHMWASSAASEYLPANFYRPVFMLWLLLCNRLSGGIPAAFHLANILLHIFVVLLVISITRRLTQDRNVALIAGLLFALHPVHIEAVVWISGGTEVVCAVLILGSLLAYLRAGESAAHPRLWLASSVLLFGLALFTKETAIVAPVAVLAHFWTVSRHRLSQKFARSALLLIPYLLVIAIYIAVRVRVLGHFAESHFESPASVVLGFPLRLGWYVHQLLWPFHLSVKYKPLDVATLSLWMTVPALLFLIASITAIVCKVRHSPAWALLGTLSFLSLCPVLLETFTGFQDRYLYLPSIGFCVLLAWLLTRLRMHDLQAARWMSAALILVIASISLATVIWEERTWETDISLFQRAVAVDPSPATFAQLASSYADEGNSTRQFAVLQDGIQRFPNSAGLWHKLGAYYFSKNQIDDAASSLARSQLYPAAPALRGQNQCLIGMVDYERGSLTSAEANLRAGLAADSSFQECRSTLALLLERSGRAAEARQQRAQLP